MINLNIIYEKDNNKSIFTIANCISLYMSSKTLLNINDVKLQHYFVTNNLRVPCVLVSRKILEREVFQIKIFADYILIKKNLERFNISFNHVILVDFLVDNKNNVLNIIPIKNEK
jgi:hypothetical protein